MLKCIPSAAATRQEFDSSDNCDSSVETCELSPVPRLVQLPNQVGVEMGNELLISATEFIKIYMVNSLFDGR